jgi:hypothetical protein
LNCFQKLTQMIYTMATFLYFVSAAIASPREGTSFDILYRDKVIGEVMVKEINTSDGVIRKLESNSTIRIIISVHVKAEYQVVRNKNGLMTEGIGSREANMGNHNVQSKTRCVAPNKYKVERNGEVWIHNDFPIDFCVADMFFSEPNGRTQVYSNMYGKNLSLVREKDRSYHLVTPDGKDSFYYYQNGKLLRVEFGTPIGKIITRRK